MKRLGLLEGRTVCVSWYHRQDFMEEFPRAPVVSDQLYRVDGDRITCSGGAGVVDLAAALVERHVGPAAARKSLNVLLLDGSRAATAAQPTPQLAHRVGDERVRRAALFMEQNLAHPLPVGDIARRLELSERQLDRIFRAELGAGPAEVYRGMRVDYGRWLLTHSRRSVSEIAVMAGFSDAAHFSRVFRARFGRTPTAARGMVASLPDDRADLPADRRLYPAG